MKALNYTGIDMGKKTFTFSVYRSGKGASRSQKYDNNATGFVELEKQMNQQGFIAEQTLLCLEDYGVYAESFCHYFYKKGYRVSLESPKKTKQAFHLEDKDDDVDAQQLAEYAFRYEDKLPLWQPPHPLVEDVNVLLGLREQLVKQKTAHENELKALEIKMIKPSFALQTLKELIQSLKTKIDQIDKELQKTVSQDPDLDQKLKQLQGIKGVGKLLPLNLLVLTNGFREHFNAKKLAARIGIVPRRYQSGTSVYRPPHSRGQGHSRLRKLLYLTSMNLVQFEPKFKAYYARLTAAGKSARLVLNNIANKLLILMEALFTKKSDFILNHRSVKPVLSK